MMLLKVSLQWLIILDKILPEEMKEDNQPTPTAQKEANAKSKSKDMSKMSEVAESGTTHGLSFRRNMCCLTRGI